jgi:hypothetical protein
MIHNIKLSISKAARAARSAQAPYCEPNENTGEGSLQDRGQTEGMLARRFHGREALERCRLCALGRVLAVVSAKVVSQICKALLLGDSLAGG